MGGREVGCGGLVVVSELRALRRPRAAGGPRAARGLRRTGRLRGRGGRVLRGIEGDLHRGDGLAGDRRRITGERQRRGLRLVILVVIRVVVFVVLLAVADERERRGRG